MSRKLIAGLLMVALLGEAPIALSQGRDHRPPPGMQGPPHDRDYGRPGGRWDGPPPRGWDHRRWQNRQSYLRNHPDRRDDHSDAVITGMLGFALGAAIAGSQDDQRYARGQMSNRRWMNYCSRRYRSFDRRSGTYLANDGLRYYCRMP
jgi:hypothetical protein